MQFHEGKNGETWVSFFYDNFEEEWPAEEVTAFYESEWLEGFSDREFHLAFEFAEYVADGYQVECPYYCGHVASVFTETMETVCKFISFCKKASDVPFGAEWRRGL